MLNYAYSFVTPWANAKKHQIIKNKIISKITCIIYMILCKFRPIYIKEQKKCDAIISLTSFPPRINGLYFCLCSIFNQTLLPQKVVLWLGEDQFPRRNEDIPQRIRKLCKLGLEIRFCEDVRSYKKILYMAQEASNKNIIIIDDDTLYPENWLERIWEAHEEHINDIICYRAHKITVDNGIINTYDKWIKLAPELKGPSKSLIPIGVGGVLYPKGCFSGVLWDIKKIKEIAPTTDDIWLKCLMLSRGYKVVKVDVNSIEWFTVLGTQKERLVKMNVEMDNKNDIAMIKCMNYFNLIPDDFME